MYHDNYHAFNGFRDAHPTMDQRTSSTSPPTRAAWSVKEEGPILVSDFRQRSAGKSITKPERDNARRKIDLSSVIP